MSSEEWRPVAGWEGFYEVSSLGRVRSLDRIVKYAPHPIVSTRLFKGRLLKPQENNRGYLHVIVGRKTVLVHKLVCEAFHGPRPEGMIVLHGPGGQQDNRACNLRWGTAQENNGADKKRDGTHVCGSRHKLAKLTEAQVADILGRRGQQRQVDVAAEFGVSPSLINLIWKRRAWAHVPCPNTGDTGCLL